MDETEASTNTASNAGRALVAMRRKILATCIVDGKEFETVVRDGQPHRLYCSDKCQKEAYRDRKRTPEELERVKALRARRKQRSEQSPGSQET